MILRNGRRETISLPNKPNRGQFGAKAEVCIHGFPHGTTKVFRPFTRTDGTKGFAQMEVPERDSCTHR